MTSGMWVIRIARRGNSRKRRTILPATAIVALAILLGPFQSRAPAQELHEAHEHMPIGPEKLGKAHFPVSCDARAQQEFEQAVAAIHSFWYEEAEKKFTEATVRDPDCSMGYWGIAMSQYYPLWYPPDAAHLKKGWDAVRKAEAIAPKTARKRDYIAAIDAFYRVVGSLALSAKKTNGRDSSVMAASRAAANGAPVPRIKSPGGISPPGGWKIYRNQEFGFSIKYPANYPPQVFMDDTHPLRCIIYDCPFTLSFYHNRVQFHTPSYDLGSEQPDSLVYSLPNKEWILTVPEPADLAGCGFLGCGSPKPQCPTEYRTKQGVPSYLIGTGYHAGDYFSTYITKHGLIAVTEGPLVGSEITFDRPESVLKVGCSIEKGKAAY